MARTPHQRIGNWRPDGEIERARLRRDYTELAPAQRLQQVCELSRFMSRVAEAGRIWRGSYIVMLLPGAVEVDLDGVPARVAGYDDLVTLKQQAARPGGLEDLRRLRQARGE